MEIKRLEKDLVKDDPRGGVMESSENFSRSKGGIGGGTHNVFGEKLMMIRGDLGTRENN